MMVVMNGYAAEAFREGLRRQTILEHLTNILQEYSSDEQILKVIFPMFEFLIVCKSCFDIEIIIV